LPAEVFVRGFLRAYARAISISVNETMAQYTLSRRSISMAPTTTKTLDRRLPRRRRWVVAFGLVALLVLFTVALSWVLRPRGRRLESELAARRTYDFVAIQVTKRRFHCVGGHTERADSTCANVSSSTITPTVDPRSLTS